MQMNSKILVVTTVLVAAAGAAEAQSLIDGFFRGDSNGDVAISWYIEEGDEFWMGPNRVQGHPLGDLSTESLNLWVAWGMSDRLEIVSSIPWVRSESAGRSMSHEGAQDGSLFVKWRAAEWQTRAGGLSLVTAAGVQTPLSDYVVESPVSIGHASTNVDGVALLHWVPREGVFVDLSGGYSFRNKGVPDALLTGVKAGFWRGPYYVDAWYLDHDSRGGHDLGQGPFQTTEVDRSRVGVTGFYRFSPMFGLAVNVSETLSGRNVVDYRAYGLSLVFTRR